jgi:hypothetical protein
LIFSYVGFHAVEYQFERKSEKLDITLEPNMEMLDGLIVVYRNIFQKIGFFFERIFSKNN